MPKNRKIGAEIGMCVSIISETTIYYFRKGYQLFRKRLSITRPIYMESTLLQQEQQIFYNLKGLKILTTLTTLLILLLSLLLLS